MNNESLIKVTDEVSVVLCGEAGQGIQTIEQMLTHVLKLAGYNVFATKEYMSRVRGGSNSTEIRVSSERVASYVDRMDIMIPLSEAAISHLEKRVSDTTVILGEKERFLGLDRMIDVPFSKLAKEAGGRIYENTVAAGVILGLIGIEFELLDKFLKKRFAGKEKKIIEGNGKAGRKGYDIGRELLHSGKISMDVKRTPSAANDLLVNGTEAVGLGAIAGGCNFVASYPMSPSTGVLVFLARHAAEFGIVVEQAEDEIAAINMGLGAWYAGARALVTTSGGGFALMSEGMSLAGMIETPIVVHMAQRPGPATGLPTRTEQADLELALYAGHGEYPRIILAPGTIQESFSLTQKAFNLADKYQVPVVVLTDQFLLDSYYNIPSLDLQGCTVEEFIVKTHDDYRRYELTDSGVSPRSIPGYGTGLLSLDSDEHDEAGHITEDLELRTKMVDKRLRKLDSIAADAIAPELVGNEDYDLLVIGWGSTYHVAREAIMKLGRTDISFLHFKQVYPLPPQTVGYLRRAKKLALIENNATAQFGKLLKLHADTDVESRILQYNGLPFSVEDVMDRLQQIVQ